MQKGLFMLLIGGVFTLLGLFAMPMKRANPRQNLIDNPFGWGLFGFGLSSLLVGISTMSRRTESEQDHDYVEETYPIIQIEATNNETPEHH